MTSTTSVRTFHDLRAFAAVVHTATSTGEDAWHGSRIGQLLADGPVTVSVVALAGSGEREARDADEFILAMSGSLEISQGSQSLCLQAGQSAVLPAGSVFSWGAHHGTTIVSMTCRTEAASCGQPVPINLDAELTPSGAPLAELLVGPTPSCRNFTDFRSHSGEFVCGTWDSTPYHRTAMRYGHHELMLLLDGAVTFIDEAGRSGTFSEGDIFLIERGASCSWESTVDVKKVYAIYRPVA